MSYLAIAKKAEERLKGTQAIEGGNPQAPTPEALAAKVLAEFEPDEVGQILALWERLFGIRLDRQRVATQLESLRRWQRGWQR